MRLFERILAVVYAVILFVLYTQVPCRAEALAEAGEHPPRFLVEVGYDVATGTYGNTTSTTTMSVPLSIGWAATPRLVFGLSIPYLWQNNADVVAGRPVRVPKTLGFGMLPITRNAPASTRNHAVSGVGDLLLSGGYAVLTETDYLPELRPSLGVKLPTADTDLGTGKTDVILGLASSKWLGAWYLYLDGDYTVQGKSSLFQARNFFDYALGVGYEIWDGLRPSIGVKGATPAEEGSGAAIEVEGRVVYALNRAFDLRFHAGRGLSVSAADWEGGCSLGFNF